MVLPRAMGRYTAGFQSENCSRPLVLDVILHAPVLTGDFVIAYYFTVRYCVNNTECNTGCKKVRLTLFRFWYGHEVVFRLAHTKN